MEHAHSCSTCMYSSYSTCMYYSYSTCMYYSYSTCMYYSYSTCMYYSYEHVPCPMGLMIHGVEYGGSGGRSPPGMQGLWGAAGPPIVKQYQFCFMFQNHLAHPPPPSLLLLTVLFLVLFWVFNTEGPDPPRSLPLLTGVKKNNKKWSHTSSPLDS